MCLTWAVEVADGGTIPSVPGGRLDAALAAGGQMLLTSSHAGT